MNTNKFMYLFVSVGITDTFDTRRNIDSIHITCPKPEVMLTTRAERSCGFRGRRGIYAPFKPRPR